MNSKITHSKESGKHERPERHASNVVENALDNANEMTFPASE